MPPPPHPTPAAGYRSRPRSVRLLVLTLVAALLAGVLGGLTPTVAAAAGPRIDLRVLVLTDGTPSIEAMRQALDREGVPSTVVDLRSSPPQRPTIDAAFLAEVTATTQRAMYQAVFVPDADLAPTPNVPGDAGLNPGEIEALRAYQATYGIRQVDAHAWPNAAVGMTTPGTGQTGFPQGGSATVTTAGAAAGFRYLDGPVPVDAGSWLYLAQPLAQQAAGTAFAPLVQIQAPNLGGTGTLIGAFTHLDGREELVITASANSSQVHQRVLAHGIITWATRGVHLGTYRNHFSVHVDDVLLPDDRWHVEGNCTVGDDCPVNADGTPVYDAPTIRMTDADAQYLRQWQARTGLKLDLAFNGAGSEEAGGSADPLTAALLANKGEFRWINHTWSHPNLGCTQVSNGASWSCLVRADGTVEWLSQARITSEIADNQRWAAANGVAMDPSELITGEHSGLRVLPQHDVDNPNLAPSLVATGIDVIASDNSREQAPRRIGSATTLPRYPMNIFYNVGTKAEEVDEYNWMYTSSSVGGSGICDRSPETTTCITPLTVAQFDTYIVPLEASIALGHVVGNDPRPHFAHQSNLAEDRILYPVIDELVRRYDAMYASSVPLVQPTMTEAAAVMARQAGWSQLVASNPGAVRAYTVDGAVHVETDLGAVEVPVTAPIGTLVNGKAVGEIYGGEQSGWVAVSRTITPAEPPVQPPVDPPTPGRTGYWMVGAKGDVYAFGHATHLGNANVGARTAVDVEATPDFNGYWVVDDGGVVHAFGTPTYGNADIPLLPGEKVTSLSSTKSGKGYWLFTNRGRSIPKGDAVGHDYDKGYMLGLRLNGPVLDSIRTSTGAGFYMVGSDGGIFSFGDANFYGSMGGKPLNAPVRSLAPDPDGVGYWLVAGDGGIFSFEAPFRGSMGGKPLNKPVVGMVPYGDGYLMVASDGGIFNFSSKPFEGSLGANPPAVPIVSVAALNER